MMRRLLLLSSLLLSYSLYGQVSTDSTVATGLHSTAINYLTSATGISSFASGQESVAIGNFSTAIGLQCTAQGFCSVALGENCLSGGQGFSFGQSCKALADQSVAIGRFVETSEWALRSMVIGNCTSASPLVNNISNSIMIGSGSNKPTIFISEAENLNGVGKVGIGTTEPVARLQVAGGDIFIENINRGIIMKSPDGNCWRGTLNNEGQLTFSQLPDCLTINTENIEPEGLDIKIFPNPANGIIEVQLNDELIKKFNTVLLYNSKGSLLFSQKVNALKVVLNITGFEPGAYIVKLVGTSSAYSETIIIN